MQWDLESQRAISDSLFQLQDSIFQCLHAPGSARLKSGVQDSSPLHSEGDGGQEMHAGGAPLQPAGSALSRVLTWPWQSFPVLDAGSKV